MPSKPFLQSEPIGRPVPITVRAHTTVRTLSFNAVLTLAQVQFYRIIVVTVGLAVPRQEALAPKETLGKDRKFTRGKKERRGKPVVTVTLTVDDEKVTVVLTLPEKKEKVEEEQVSKLFMFSILHLFVNSSLAMSVTILLARGHISATICKRFAKVKFKRIYT